MPPYQRGIEVINKLLIMRVEPGGNSIDFNHIWTPDLYLTRVTQNVSIMREW